MNTTETLKIKNKGTPKTLKDAVLNGIAEYFEHLESLSEGRKEIEQYILPHVEDYFNQRFCVEMLKHEHIADTLHEIKKNIFKE